MNRCEGMGRLVIFLCFMLVAAGVMMMAIGWGDLKVSIPNTGSQTLVWTEELDLAMQAVVVDPTYSHAVEEHGEQALLVRECLKRDGPYVTFQIDPGRRYLRVCILEDQSIGFQIVDAVGKMMKERTAYIKDNFTCIKDIFDYARRMGYPRFTKPIF